MLRTPLLNMNTEGKPCGLPSVFHRIILNADQGVSDSILLKVTEFKTNLPDGAIAFAIYIDRNG